MKKEIGNIEDLLKYINLQTKTFEFKNGELLDIYISFSFHTKFNIICNDIKCSGSIQAKNIQANNITAQNSIVAENIESNNIKINDCGEWGDETELIAKNIKSNNINVHEIKAKNIECNNIDSVAYIKAENIVASGKIETFHLKRINAKKLSCLNKDKVISTIQEYERAQKRRERENRKQEKLWKEQLKREQEERKIAEDQKNAVLEVFNNPFKYSKKI